MRYGNKNKTFTSYSSHPRVWLEIDLKNLCRNYRRIQQTVSPSEVMPVLKANAYGIGVEKVASALSEAGARRFGVADLGEALTLRKLGFQAQILGTVMADEITAALDAEIIMPVNDLKTGREISRQSADRQRSATCHILVDSGMGRLGIPIEQAGKKIQQISELPGLKLEGIYSHFPIANYPENNFTRRQIKKFSQLLSSLHNNGIEFKKIHIANSDGINNFPEATESPFNLVRSGINLYGTFDLLGGHAYRLQSVLSLKSRLAQVRRIPPETPIGYGHTWISRHQSILGTVSAGYADGVPVALSNRGRVLIQGQPCPIIGNVSMDYCTVCLDNVPQARTGEEVVLLGEQNNNAITVKDWAELKNSNTYDIICAFGSRVIRQYL